MIENIIMKWLLLLAVGLFFIGLVAFARWADSLPRSPNSDMKPGAMADRAAVNAAALGIRATRAVRSSFAGFAKRAVERADARGKKDGGLDNPI